MLVKVKMLFDCIYSISRVFISVFFCYIGFCCYVEYKDFIKSYQKTQNELILKLESIESKLTVMEKGSQQVAIANDSSKLITNIITELPYIKKFKIFRLFMR